jgi:hypothetical protein
MDSFLFNSRALDSYVLADSVIPTTQREELILTSGDAVLHGYFIKQPDSLRVEPHPTIIYHHGNKWHLQYYWPRVELLYKAGADVLIYDYRGYGKSTGSSSEASMQEDAKVILDYVRSRPDVDTSQIFHYGFSLGGYPAMYSASHLPSARGLITEAIFASGQTLVQTGTLLNVPGSYLLKGEYNNAGNSQLRTCPLLMFHGGSDTFIPFDVHAEQIYDAARQPKTLIKVDGAGHEGIPQSFGYDAYVSRIRAFIRGN